MTQSMYWSGNSSPDAAAAARISAENLFVDPRRRPAPVVCHRVAWFAPFGSIDGLTPPAKAAFGLHVTADSPNACRSQPLLAVGRPIGRRSFAGIVYRKFPCEINRGNITNSVSMRHLGDRGATSHSPRVGGPPPRVF
jgi:hypothetical protein